MTDLEDGDIKKAFMKSCPSIQEAVDLAISQKGEDAKVLFLMDGSVTVPLISSG